jgi:hypothetical protein
MSDTFERAKARLLDRIDSPRAAELELRRTALKMEHALLAQHRLGGRAPASSQPEPR